MLAFKNFCFPTFLKMSCTLLFVQMNVFITTYGYGHQNTMDFDHLFIRERSYGQMMSAIRWQSQHDKDTIWETELMVRGVSLSNVEAEWKQAVCCGNSWPAIEGQYLESHSVDLTQGQAPGWKVNSCSSPAFCLTGRNALLCLSLDRIKNHCFGHF